ncbi:MAG: ABC transporter permease [Planctomycetota bacterium]|nr:MAG: ABC transporter permease [Planctomycetota bacterium]
MTPAAANAPSQARSPGLASVARQRSVGFWAEAWRRFSCRPLAMSALVLVTFLFAVAVFAPAIAGTKPVVCRYKGRLYAPCLAYFDRRLEPAIFTHDRFRGAYPRNLQEKDPASWAVWPLLFQDPYRAVRENEWPGQPANPTRGEGSPNRWNLFGTDQYGVDVLAKMIHGTTTALLVGLVSMGIAGSIGIIVGALGGYFGGWVDMLASRVTEVVMCIPTLVLILALMAIVEKPTIWKTMAILGITGWTGIARLTRAEFLRLRNSEFVLAARATGAGPLRIMIRHILPNALAPVLVPISFGIASAILTESSLSFLGFGTPPPSASWGAVLNDARSNLHSWWLVVFPGMAIFLTVLAYNLVGEGLQAATDPRLREARK